MRAKEKGNFIRLIQNKHRNLEWLNTKSHIHQILETVSFMQRWRERDNTISCEQVKGRKTLKNSGPSSGKQGCLRPRNDGIVVSVLSVYSRILVETYDIGKNIYITSCMV